MNDKPEFMTHDRIMTGEEYVSYSDYLLLQKERDEAIEKHRFAVIHWQIGVFKMQRERDEARDAIVGWENKWNAAIGMAAIAENERDLLKEELINLEDQRDPAMKVIKRLEAQLAQKEP